jgi:predicted HNH restriction endonuclease
MAFRDGKNGPSLWHECHQQGIAAIEYDPVENIDLVRDPQPELKRAWSQLAPSQRASLRRFLKMKEGDIIYVKEGPRIIGQGVVAGPYQFDQTGSVKSATAYWRHQRVVRWAAEFPELVCQLGIQQIVTVMPLDVKDISRIEKLVRSRGSATVLRGDEGKGGDLDDEYLEGGEVFKLHRQKERNRTAAQRKKERVLAAQGKLACEVCDFDFAEVYGPLGEGFAECHHRVPLAELKEEHPTRLSDLAIVCGNCHRMLHRPPFHTVESLRTIVISRKRMKL